MMTSKRGNGEGSVYSKGKLWIAKITYKEGGKIKRAQRQAPSKSKALVFLQELIDEHSKPKKGNKTTLADYLNGWIARSVDGELALSTAENYRTTVNMHIIPYLGDFYTSNLTAMKIADWLKELEKEGVGRRTRQNAYAILSSALSLGAKWEEIESNPCLLVDKPRYEREPINPFTVEELRSILNATEDLRLGALYQIGLRLGVRQGEIFGLEWQDFDKTAMTLSIVRQAVEVKGRIHIKPPKSKSGVRVIELDQDCVDALLQRKAFALREGFAQSPAIFPNRKGQVMQRSNFGNRHWKPLLDKLKIDHRGFHHCRHTAATLMLANGVDVTTVCRILGHSKPSVTLDLYSHFIPKNGAKAVQIISRTLHG